MSNKQLFQKILLGPIVLTVILTVGFLVLLSGGTQQEFQKMLDAGTGALAIVASAFTIILSFLAGVWHNRDEKITFNGFWIASLPVAILFAIIIHAVLIS